MKNQPILWLALACLLAVPVCAQSGRQPQAVTIKLTNGETLRCVWQRADESQLEAQCPGARTINLNQIASIEFTREPSPAPLSLDGLSEKQISAIKDAVLALRKLNDAVDVGVSRLLYKERLADTRTIVDTAMMLLPDGKLKSQLAFVLLLHLVTDGATTSKSHQEAKDSLKPLIELVK